MKGKLCFYAFSLYLRGWFPFAHSCNLHLNNFKMNFNLKENNTIDNISWAIVIICGIAVFALFLGKILGGFYYHYTH